MKNVNSLFSIEEDSPTILIHPERYDLIEKSQIDKLIQLVNHLTNEVRELNEVVSKNQNNGRLQIRCEDGQVRLISNDLLICCKAAGSYCEFHLTNGAIHIASNPLSYYQQQLNASVFFRSHRSWLVNLSKVTGFDPFESVIHAHSKKRIPLSKSNLVQFKNRIAF